MSLIDAVKSNPTRENFAKAILEGLEAPLSDSNVKGLVAWMAQENTKAANNPMATTWDMPGSTAFNYYKGKPLVKNYPDPETGIRAQIKTLQSKHYRGILAGLKTGNFANAIADTNAKEWDTYCGHGERYREGIASRMNLSIGSDIKVNEGSNVTNGDYVSTDSVNYDHDRHFIQNLHCSKKSIDKLDLVRQNTDPKVFQSKVRSLLHIG